MISYDEALLPLNKAGIEHIRTVWTTDAFYRETAVKVKRRLAARERKLWIWLQPLWLCPKHKPRSINFSIRLTMWDHHNHEWDARREDRKIRCYDLSFDIAVDIALELENKNIDSKSRNRKGNEVLKIYDTMSRDLREFVHPRRMFQGQRFTTIST